MAEEPGMAGEPNVGGEPNVAGNPNPAEKPRGVSVPARIALFGFDLVPATARIEARSVGWRARRTALALVVGLVVAPVVALIPPHAPWVLAALGLSGLIARRRWTEQHTLHFLAGDCPRCGEDISVSRPVRLRHPHPIPCPSCQYELAVSVDL